MRERREDWLTRKLETLDEHVKEERRRLHEAKKQQALQALISLCLPELLGEVDRSDAQDASCERVATSVTRAEA